MGRTYFGQGADAALDFLEVVVGQPSLSQQGGIALPGETGDEAGVDCVGLGVPAKGADEVFHMGGIDLADGRAFFQTREDQDGIVAAGRFTGDPEISVVPQAPVNELGYRCRGVGPVLLFAVDMDTEGFLGDVDEVVPENGASGLLKLWLV